MKLGIMAARTAKAVETISDKTGIDVSVSSFPKTKDAKVQRMHQLERLADELPEKGTQESYDVDVLKILELVKETKGVGDALYKRIEDQILG